MELRLRRILTIVPALGTCALFSACGGGGAGTDNPPSAPAATAGTTSPRVVIHITGLVLVVPPRSGQTKARMLLPPLNSPKHRARLGFGMDPGNAAAAILCVEAAMVAKDGICYVDLETWKLDEFGVGGTPVPDSLDLPRGVMDARRLVGGLHAPPAPTSNIPEVVFVSGWAGPSYCSLANWTYEPRGPQGDTLPPETQALVNVLEWQIDGLPNPTLTFRRTNPNREITVPLVPAKNDRIELILANIPTGDYKDLPPGAPKGLGVRPAKADHVHAYYDVLFDNNQHRPDSARRAIPRNPRPLTTRACPVAITRGGVEGLIAESAAAIGTYACIVAYAEPT